VKSVNHGARTDGFDTHVNDQMDWSEIGPVMNASATGIGH